MRSSALLNCVTWTCVGFALRFCCSICVYCNVWISEYSTRSATDTVAPLLFSRSSYHWLILVVLPLCPPILCSPLFAGVCFVAAPVQAAFDLSFCWAWVCMCGASVATVCVSVLCWGMNILASVLIRRLSPYAFFVAYVCIKLIARASGISIFKLFGELWSIARLVEICLLVRRAQGFQVLWLIVWCHSDESYYSSAWSLNIMTIWTVPCRIFAVCGMKSSKRTLAARAWMSCCWLRDGVVEIQSKF